MGNTIEGFGKRIRNLIRSVTTGKNYFAILNALANKVELYVDVLGPLVDSCVVGEIFRSIIVNFDFNWLIGKGRIQCGT